jgi:hypothetical protein
MNVIQEINWSSDEGYEQLITIQRFSFGGVGIVGTISDGEFAFRAVLRSPESAKLFKTAYLQATEEGKLYALCGIRATDRSSFENYAAALRSTTNEVAIQSGCIVDGEKVAKVVRQIADGVYDSYLAER